MPATMPAKSTITRVWDYAEETGQDVRDVYVKLLTVIGITSPEVVDAAFAEMQARGTRGERGAPVCSCGHFVVDDRSCTCTGQCPTCASEDCCAETWGRHSLMKVP